MIRTALAVLASGLLPSCIEAVAADRLGFNRDVRPILAEPCFGCHGRDAPSREAGLRLDLPMLLGGRSTAGEANEELLEKTSQPAPQRFQTEPSPAAGLP